MPRLLLHLDVVASTLPRDHVWQLPLHELLHALVLRRIRQEEAEGLEVPGGVAEQVPHGRCHVWGRTGAGGDRLLLAALLSDLEKE